MFSLEIERAVDGKDLLIAELWEAGSAGIVELSDSRVRAFFHDGADRGALMERFGAVSWRAEEERDWVAESRAGWEPQLVGERFFLVPEWRDDPAPEGRFRVVVNPGMAFGTGRHESTQLCLEALERWVQPGVRVLDVGTGTGILAEAARLLGAGCVWACDVDADAVAVARGGAETNLFVGSADATRAGSADVVVANISPEAIIALAPELLGCLRPDGVAIVSGFEGYTVPAVAAELERRGGTILEKRDKHEWALLVVGGTLVGRVSNAYADNQTPVS